ncbi:MAG: beta-ketoacyl-[acyl-carrier-protein] synthase family protein [Bacteroidales bacterium]|nr:beta-ketoacyl-[acyl-carrier-protein] synthase family protein [Bacteroidales bacterium]
MSERVFVTGIGIIAATGFDCKAAADALQQSKSGIGKITLFDTIYKDEIPVAEVKATNKELAEMAAQLEQGRFTRTALLGLIAARQALLHAAINDARQYRTGLISATTTGGMDRSERFYKEFLRDNRRGRLRDIITHDCGDSTERIADATGIKDYVSTISTACSSSANAILVGSQLIRNGMLDRVLVGGVDSFTLFTLNGFNCLMILDKNGCRPFDDDRNGLTLGEGAGFLVIESEKTVVKDNKPVLCEVSGYGNACDAYHQTASSPEGDGAYLSMKKALEMAKLEPGKIHYINAHGTGTKNNDLSEGKAIERLFQNVVPRLSSTKAFTGHTLGAAGAIEAVLCVMAIQHQWIYPNLCFNQPMKELHFSPVTDFQYDVPVHHVMSNSFGFGGNNTSLIFSRY